MGIKDEFNEIASKYDQQRRLLIPCFDDFYKMPLEAINYCDDSPSVLDIGSGTGLFSSFILQKYPNAKITMIDLAEDLIEIAKERFKAHSEFCYIIADYTKHVFSRKFDIIISALSIHHLDNHDKRELYKKCYSMLSDDGCFINADQVLSPSDYIEKLNLDALHEYHKNTTLSGRDIEMAYERMKYDNPATLYEQTQWLYDAGFRHVDCLFKYYQFCVMYAKK